MSSNTINRRNIPNLKKDIVGKYMLMVPEDIKNLPDVYNEVTTEINGDFFIKNTQTLEFVDSFNNINNFKSSIYFNDNLKLKTIKSFRNLNTLNNSLYIENNTELYYITGFNNLNFIGGHIWLIDNPKLIALSLPTNIFKSLNIQDKNSYIRIEDKNFDSSIEEFINSPQVIDDCISKFDENIHNIVLINQICDNLKLWATPATKSAIVNHLVSKGAKDYIPKSFL